MESLREHTAVHGLDVLVVDNGSTDGTPAECPVLGRELFGDAFTYLRNETNRNFAGACNQGAHRASGRYLLFLNNDTLLTQTWLPPLVDALEQDPGLGAVGPLLLYPEVGPLRNRVQHLGIACRPQLYPVHLFEYFPENHPAVRTSRHYQALTAAVLTISRKRFLDMGGFFEGYINGGEDIDLCCTLRRKGFSLTCVLESRVYHYASQTPGRHDHEQHNARLLKERGMDALLPDLHLIGARHGYELRLSEHMVDMLCLPERRTGIYAKSFAEVLDHGDVPALIELMDREPLFEPVYGRLAARYVADGEPGHAAHILLVRAKLFPTMENVMALRRQALEGGLPELSAFAQGLEQNLTAIPMNSNLRDLARSMAVFADELRQPALSAMYREKLDAMRGVV